MSKQKRKLQIINSEASGIDVGSEKIFIAVDGQDVKSFNTFTNSFAEAVRYLQKNEVKTVAMESTGVYWITLYDMIKEAGIEVYVVNEEK